MPDWSASMQQTFEYYIVDPATWKDVRRIGTVKKATINNDSTLETLGSATFDVTEALGECYMRTYLVTIQNGVQEKHPLGTHLVQTPSSSFDGKTNSISMDAYTPLLELKEKMPPIGYSLLKDENIMSRASMITRENLRAPVVAASSDDVLTFDFVADLSDTWMTFLTDLIANAKYKFGIDELGRILFQPNQDTASLQPVWTYTDDNSSILYPDLNVEHDLYGIPNVVEVVYTHSNRASPIYSRAINDDPNSPVSTVSRGREIIKRVQDPDIAGSEPTQFQVDEYAKRCLRDSSTVEYTISYTHGYCPVRVGDCVRFNYSRAGLRNIKARVISQSIKCEPGCQVTEKAIITTKLWR